MLAAHIHENVGVPSAYIYGKNGNTFVKIGTHYQFHTHKDGASTPLCYKNNVQS